MPNQRVTNLAKVLVNYSTEVREKDLVAIIGRPTATPLIREIYREVLRCGGYPYLMSASIKPWVPGYEGLDQIFMSECVPNILSLWLICSHKDVLG